MSRVVAQEMGRLVLSKFAFVERGSVVAPMVGRGAVGCLWFARKKRRAPGAPEPICPMKTTIALSLSSLFCFFQHE